MPEKDLGKLIGVYLPSAASLQKVTIVAVIAFLFFLATLGVFYVRQQIGFFILSTAFLILYLLAMVGIILQRRGNVKVYENGITYRKFSAAWNEISRVRADRKNGISISTKNGETASVPPSIANRAALVLTIRKHLSE